MITFMTDLNSVLLREDLPVVVASLPAGVSGVAGIGARAR
jgi:hypothetical protein